MQIIAFFNIFNLDLDNLLFNFKQHYLVSKVRCSQFLIADGMQEDQWQLEEEKLSLDVRLRNVHQLIKTEADYAGRWERQWSAENREVLQTEMHDLRRQLSEAAQNGMLENNSVQEAKHVFAKYAANVSRCVADWERRRDRLVSVADVELMDLERDVEEANKTHERMVADADRLRTAVEPLATRKADRERRARFLAHVVRIQAFWRGVMVRRHLGPYAYLVKLRKRADRGGKKSKRGKKRK